jgi:hypothetical protein
MELAAKLVPLMDLHLELSALVLAQLVTPARTALAARLAFIKMRAAVAFRKFVLQVLLLRITLAVIYMERALKLVPPTVLRSEHSAPVRVRLVTLARPAQLVQLAIIKILPELVWPNNVRPVQ